MSLNISNLIVSIENKQILNGISLKVLPGELHVVMGPNGSGKSTLAQAIMGHPRYKVHGGQLTVNGKDITKLSPDKRAKLGLFLAFQHPVEISGVKLYQFLRSAKRAGSRKDKRIKNGEVKDFIATAKSELKAVGMEENFLERSVNEGFSGGEKKRSEIFQMAMLSPKVAILDEPDSGLDVDGMKIVAEKINEVQQKKTAVVLISHNPRLLRFLKPDKIHVIKEGMIVKSGSAGLAKDIERRGFEN